MIPVFMGTNASIANFVGIDASFGSRQEELMTTTHVSVSINHLLHHAHALCGLHYIVPQ